MGVVLGPTVSMDDRLAHALYVVPTPIGNLEDVTLRAIRVLGQATLILAEDTRHTRRLLEKYGIDTPMRPYHQHNKRAALESIMQALGEGDVALVSDAGMPSVSDPGFELIEAVVDAGLTVDVLPGASAAVTAVVGAALPAPGFLVLGFLPRKSGDRRRSLQALLPLPYSLVMYESPHRLVALLQDIERVLGDRRIVVARELTKMHQEYARGAVSDVLARFSEAAPRGECTIVVAGDSGSGAESDPNEREEALEEVRRRAAGGESRRVVFADVGARYNLRRAELYSAWLEARSSDDGDGPAETP